jgi:hypothetical protein
MRAYARVVGVLAVVAALVVGCGGDDADTNGGVDATAGATTIPSTVGNIPGVSSECEALANLSLSISQVFAGSFQGVPNGVVDALPSEARADGQIIADALVEFDERLDELGIDLSDGMASLSPEQLEAFGDVSGEVLNDDVDAAVNRIGIQMADDCAPGA